MLELVQALVESDPHAEFCEPKAIHYELCENQNWVNDHNDLEKVGKGQPC